MPSDQDISTITAIPNEGQLTIQEAFKRAADLSVRKRPP
jgi:hypothetical protein